MLNLIANMASVGVSLVLGFFFTPFLVGSLGPAAYGMVPLATTLVSYFSIFSQVVASASSLQLSRALHGKNSQSAASVFKSVGRGCQIGALFLLPALVVMALTAPYWVSFPAGMETELRILLLAVGLNLCVEMLSIRYRSALFSKNRLYVDASAVIIQTVLRVGLATALFLMFSANLLYVALGLSIGVLASNSFRIWRVHRTAPELFGRDAAVDPAVIKSVKFTAGGIAVGRMSDIFLLSSDILLVNLLFGATQSGLYAAVLQLALITRLAGTTVAGSFSPTVLNLYSKDEIEKSVAHARSAMRAIGNMLSIPTGLLVGTGGVFLNAWLGDQFADFGMLLGVMLVGLPATVSAIPLFAVILGADKNRLSGYVSLLTGIVHIALAYTLAVVAGLGLMGVAISATGVIVLRNLVFIPIYVARISGTQASPIFIDLIRPLFVMGAVAVASYFAVGAVGATTLFWLGITFCPIALAGCLLAFALTSHDDRTKLFVSIHQFSPALAKRLRLPIPGGQ